MSELEELKAKLAAAEAKLANQPKPVVKLKMTEKGMLSISGLKPGWPITLDPDVYRLLDSRRDEINAFLNEKKAPTVEG